MLRIFYRSLALAAALVAVSHTGLLADNDHPQQGGTSAPIVCGSDWMNQVDHKTLLENTRRLDPKTYNRMMAQYNSKTAPKPMRTADDRVTYDFNIINRVTGTYETFTAALFYEGTRSVIWIDVRDTTRMKASSNFNNFVTGLSDGLENKTPSGSRNPQQGIIANDIDVYGDPPINGSQEGKIWFVLVDIQDGFNGGGFVAGYFSPTDQKDVPASNHLNMLYIDDKEGYGTGSSANIANIVGTMAHELQHLIHYRWNNSSDTFPNEGCSEEASILNGYEDRSVSGYTTNTNVSMFRWSGGSDPTPILEDYTRAMMMLHYAREQYGELFLNKLLRTQTEGAQRFNDALKAMGSNDNFNYILKGFGVANYVQGNQTDRRYRYQNVIANGGLPTGTKSITSYNKTTAPTSGSVQLETYAIRYIAFGSPDVTTFSFTSSNPAAVMAILYRGTAVMEVRELKTDGTSYKLEFSPDRAYDKVVLVFVNTFDGQQTINWTASTTPSGVKTEENINASMRVAASPNPSHGMFTVDVTLPTTEAATLDIYDQSGKLLRTVFDGSRFEAGTHRIAVDLSELPSGHYIARLKQNDRTAAESLIIVK